MAFEFHKMGRPEEHTIHPVVAPPAAAAVAGLCRNRPLRHHAIMQMHAWLQLGQHCTLFKHANNSCTQTCCVVHGQSLCSHAMPGPIETQASDSSDAVGAMHIQTRQPHHTGDTMSNETMATHLRVTPCTTKHCTLRQPCDPMLIKQTALNRHHQMVTPCKANQVSAAASNDGTMLTQNKQTLGNPIGNVVPAHILMCAD